MGAVCPAGPNDKGLSRKHIIEGTKASLKRLDQVSAGHHRCSTISLLVARCYPSFSRLFNMPPDNLRRSMSTSCSATGQTPSRRWRRRCGT